MNKHTKSLYNLLCLMLAMLLCLGTSATAMAEADTEYSEEEILEVLEGKTAGVMTGTPQDAIIQAKISNVEIQYFNSATDLALALEKRKIDFIALPTVNYYNLVPQYTDLGYIDVPLAIYDVGTVFAKTEKGDALRAQMNEFIAQLRESGELQKMQDYWLYPNDWENVDIPQTGENGTLTFATTSTLKPFSFKLNDSNVGFEVDIAARFCTAYGYALKIEDVDFAGILSGIISGKYDFAAGQISWTEERAKSLNFSDFYYTQTFVPIVNAKYIDSPALITVDSDSTDENNASDSETQDATSNENALMKSIRRTLIEEGRWKSVLQGMAVTLLITCAGFVLANMLGALFCAMSLSKSKILKAIAGLYSRLMQGLPIVVILMILYYIIFGSSKVSNITVAICGFGLVYGAYMAQLFEGGIGGVEKGQSEAALAIGLTKRQTFFGIVLPQAIRTMLPGYFSNLISLMKGTSVVGYIAVTDLTKAGDIIRSNTYEAFVPLIVVAIFYFALACIMLAIMNLIRKKLCRRHGRAVKIDLNNNGGAQA